MHRLPNEILEAIFAHFCCHCIEETESSLNDSPSEDPSRQEGKTTLANLCLVTSRLRAIAQPVLYHRISLRWNNTDKLVSLLRIMISRPEIASSVKQLVFDMLRDPDISYADGNLCTQAALMGGHSLPDDWYLRKEYEWPQELSLQLVSELLTRLPCVEAMRLTITLFQSSTASFPVVRSIPSLPRLRTLMLDCHHRRHGRFHLADMSALFQMACNLDYLCISYCRDVSTQLPLNSITHMRLVHSRFSFADMDRLLSSCRRLKVFSYSPIETGEAVRSNEVLSLLKRHGHDKTLSTLVLDHMGWCPSSRRINSMSGFSNLKSLELGRFTVICSSNGIPSTFATSLPICLECFVFKDPGDYILGDLYAIRDLKSQGQLPRLKDIYLISLQERLPVMTLLAEKFKALDVFCRISRP